MINHDPSARVVLEDYRNYARFPDFSRPLTSAMKDLTEPWKHVDEPLPLIDKPMLRTEAGVKQYMSDLKKSGKTDSEIEAELKKYYESLPRYQFAANRHTLTYGDELVVTLKVVAPDTSRLAYYVREAVVLPDPTMFSGALGSAEFNDRGFSPDEIADDGVTTFSWKIPREDKKYWGNLRLQVTLRVQNQKDPVQIVHGFYASPIAPATFLDSFSERIENGNLVIDVLVDVKRECKFVFQSNLFDYRGRPMHWATVNAVFEPGVKPVSFVFFGKIFWDDGFEGRYTLRDLRGTCENLPFPARWIGDPARVDAITSAAPRAEPFLYYLPYTALQFTTQKEYRLNDFNKAEWSSPEKDAKLRELESAAQREQQR